MKTRTKNTTLALSLVILISAYFFASASLINVSKNPGALSVVTTSPLSSYEKAMAVEFKFEEEEYINDIPFNTTDIRDFNFEEEGYIDDIPESINNAVF